MLGRARHLYSTLQCCPKSSSRHPSLFQSSYLVTRCSLPHPARSPASASAPANATSVVGPAEPLVSSQAGPPASSPDSPAASPTSTGPSQGQPQPQPQQCTELFWWVGVEVYPVPWPLSESRAAMSIMRAQQFICWSALACSREPQIWDHHGAKQEKIPVCGIFFPLFRLILCSPIYSLAVTPDPLLVAANETAPADIFMAGVLPTKGVGGLPFVLSGPCFLVLSGRRSSTVQGRPRVAQGREQGSNAPLCPALPLPHPRPAQAPCCGRGHAILALHCC